MMTRRFYQRLLIVMVVLGLTVLGIVLIYKNQARFYSKDDNKTNAISLVEEYSESDKRSMRCEVVLKEGYPKRSLEKIGDIISKNQVVWDYNWRCSSKSEVIEGILTVFADGNTVWAGTSSVRGDLSTKEY